MGLLGSSWPGHDRCISEPLNPNSTRKPKMPVFPRFLAWTFTLAFIAPFSVSAHNGGNHGDKGDDPTTTVLQEYSINKYITECGGHPRKDIYSTCDAPEGQGTNQMTIFNEGYELARGSQRLVILEYGANWCGACKRVHQIWKAESDADKAVRAELDQKFVFIPINADGPISYESVAQKVGAGVAEGYPTTYILDPQTAEIKARVALYQASDISSMKTMLIDAVSGGSNATSGAEAISYMDTASIGLLNSDIDISSVNVGPAFMIADAKTEVDRLVNAGTAFMNVFDWSSAYRAYNKAVSLDGQNIYAHVGRILAAHELDSSQAAILVNDSYEYLSAQLKNLSLSERERLFARYGVAVIHTKASNFVPKAGESLLDTRSVFREMAKALPNDLEVLVLINWNSGSYDMSLLEKAYEINPRHAGVNHYMGHMYEGMQDHDKAFGYLKTLAEVAPDGAHAQHMYGHVLPLVGEWEKADEQFALSHKIHLDWAEKNGVPAYEDWHYPHNLHLWGVVKLALGKTQEAVALMDEGCKTDFRACLTWFELNVVLGNAETVASTASMFYQQTSQWKQFLGILLLEAAFQNGKEKDMENFFAEYQATDKFAKFDEYQPKDRFETLLMLMMNSRDSGLSDDVKDLLRKEFDEKLDGAGFDAWTSGLLQLTRYLKVVETLGDEELAAELKQKLRKLAPKIYSDIEGK